MKEEEAMTIAIVKDPLQLAPPNFKKNFQAAAERMGLSINGTLKITIIATDLAVIEEAIPSLGYEDSYIRTYDMFTEHVSLTLITLSRDAITTINCIRYDKLPKESFDHIRDLKKCLQTAFAREEEPSRGSNVNPYPTSEAYKLG